MLALVDVALASVGSALALAGGALASVGGALDGCTSGCTLLVGAVILVGVVLLVEAIFFIISSRDRPTLPLEALVLGAKPPPILES